MIQRRLPALLLATLTLSLLSLSANAQNITPDMIEKARAAGISQSQIDAAMKQQQGAAASGNSANVVRPRATATALDRNVKADSIYRVNESVARVEDKSKKLSVFGREIFSQKNLTFAPNFNLATPKSYRLGPGDELMINVYGASEDNITQKISADGRIVIPNLGPVSLAGLTIEGAESKLRSTMSKIYSGLNGGGTHLTLSLRNIRSIKVNMVGEVVAPGTYTLPSLATLFNALYVAGGVNDIGSLRSIKVYRGSALVGDLDVYDYLLNGRFNSNVRLEDNDMVVVSPYDKLVTIDGNVKRPRIYEMKKGETLADAIRFAGDFKSDAYSANVNVQRTNGRQYEVHTIDRGEFAAFKMQDGDQVAVGEAVKTFTNRIAVFGAVQRPGVYALSEKINSVKQLLDKAEGVRGDAFLTRAQITRTLPDSSKLMVAVDLYALLNNKIGDIMLENKDILFVPSIYDLQKEFTVKIRGAVDSAATYPYRKDMTVEDLILMAGGLRYDASLQKIEIARRIRDPYSQKPTEKAAEVFEFKIDEDLRISSDAKRFTLQPYDEVFIRISPGYEKQKSVTVNGEVVFRGDFVLSNKNERLSDVISKTGGLTPQAYIKGTRLLRKMSHDDSVRVISLIKLAARKSSKRDSIDVKKLEIGSEYFVGIDLEKAIKNPGSEYDIVLRDGDVVEVPQFSNTVRISGAVLYPNTVTYKKRMSLSDYISMAGGYDGDARKSKAFVIYMNGTASRKTFWHNPKIEPGCEIVVPTKPERKGVSAGEILGFTSSIASIGAMIATILSVTK